MGTRSKYQRGLDLTVCKPSRPRHATIDTILAGKLLDIYRTHGQLLAPSLNQEHCDLSELIRYDFTDVGTSKVLYFDRYLKYTPYYIDPKLHPHSTFGVLVRVNRNPLGRHKIVWFTSELLAINFAYGRHKFPSQCKNDHLHITPRTLDISVHYRVLKPIFKQLHDHEYNQLIMCPQPPFATWKPQPIVASLPDYEVHDEAVYEHFETLFDRYLEQPCQPVRTFSKSCCVGSLEAMQGEQVLLGANKREVDFDFVDQCVRRNGFTPIVTEFPKNGCITSNNRIRSIYPMNIMYECVLRQFFGDRPMLTDYNVIQGTAFPKNECLLFGYDIRSCDHLLYPHLIRYAKTRNLTHILTPLVNSPTVHDPRNFGYPLHQFASGVYHTTIVVTLFTFAMLKARNISSAYVQGDGFLCGVSLPDDPHVVFVGCNQLNGFRKHGGRWRYDRAHRLTAPKFNRGAGPTGKNRYAILHRAYTDLGALDVEPNRLLGTCPAYSGRDLCSSCGVLGDGRTHIYDMGATSFYRSVCRYYTKLHRLVYLAAGQFGYQGRDERNNEWQACESEVTCDSMGYDAGFGLRWPRYRFT